MSSDLVWQLLYTKPRAETWAEINLRKQGFATLLPRIRSRSRFAPLFPRYIFTGHHVGHRLASLRSTFGVLYVVHCGDRPARVPLEVIEDLRARMDAHGVVQLHETPSADPLFAKAQRERIRALEKLVRAGYRVKVKQKSRGASAL